MLHLLPWLTTFNLVMYINGSELNNCCGVSSICNSLHIELHLMVSTWLLHFAMPCILKLNMHHTWVCIMSCLCLCVSLQKKTHPWHYGPNENFFCHGCDTSMTIIVTKTRIIIDVAGSYFYDKKLWQKMGFSSWAGQRHTRMTFFRPSMT
jgi:hypothetical protein